jgi:pilus assembly protein CpaB
MAKRILAAVVALVLAGVGVALVAAYANGADKRALEGMETVDVLVAKEAIAEGTPAEELADLVDVEQVPLRFAVSGGVDSLEDLAGRILTASLVAGEQVSAARFATPEEIRAAGQFTLPDEAADLHRITIPLDAPRAVGGYIAPGDTVGVFVSLDPADGGPDAAAAEEGDVQNSPSSDEFVAGSGGMTHLELHKVLVTAVEGSRVTTAGDGEGEQASGGTVLVTLALAAADAEKLVYAMEFGTVWLSLEPESASEDDTKVVVTLMPRRASELRDVFE